MLLPHDVLLLQLPMLCKPATMQSQFFLQIRSAASSAVYLRHRSAAASSNGQSFQKANELILPKTYITREGHLVLFAVIDNELFALVDTSRTASRVFNDVKSHLGNENVEMLSQFSTLEEFVLAVLSYKHTKVITKCPHVAPRVHWGPPHLFLWTCLFLNKNDIKRC